MGKDTNIHLKLEVSRDKSSGELKIITHFNLDAPNVFHDSNGYFWCPTEEEKDLISDSFELMPSAKTKPSLDKISIESTPRPDTDESSQPPIKTEEPPKPVEPEPVPEIVQSEPELTPEPDNYSEPTPTPEIQKPEIKEEEKVEEISVSTPPPTPEIQKPGI